MTIKEAATLLACTEKDIKDNFWMNDCSTINLSFRIAEREDGSVYGSLTEFRNDYADTTIAWIHPTA